MNAYKCIQRELVGQSHDSRSAVDSDFRTRRRSVWVICASITLLSARHLLVEQNIHYPLQLYLNHVAALGVVALRQYWKTWPVQPREGPVLSKPTARGTVLTTAAFCFSSLSTICTLQACLHVQNLPTLAMAVVSSSTHRTSIEHTR